MLSLLLRAADAAGSGEEIRFVRKPVSHPRGSAGLCGVVLTAWLIAGGSCLIAPGCGAKTSENVEASAPSAAHLMKSAADARDWSKADQYSRQALIENPNDPEVLTTAAVIAAFSERKREGAMMLVDAARIANYEPKFRVESAVSALVDVGEIYAAIDLLEASLQRHPERHDHRQVLVGFWNEVQRAEKIPPHLQKLIQARQFTMRLLLSTTDTSTRRLSLNTADRLLERNPNDHRVRLSDAFVFLYRRNAPAAAKVLEEILEHHPDFAPAHAMYGQALTAALRWSEIPGWLQQAPVGSSDYADYWLTLGDFALHQGEPTQAVRAFWEATRRDPNQSSAWDRLRLAIQQLDATEQGDDNQVTAEQVDRIMDHANRLLVLREAFNDFTGGSHEDQTAAVRVADALLRVGRRWEAEAWSALASTMKEEPSERLPELRDVILASLRRDSSWIAKDTPAMAIDLSRLPLPELDPDLNEVPSGLLVPSIATHEHIRMEDQTDARGLRSVGDGNDPSDPRLAALIRSTGVGGGSFDYDLDGWPDLMIINAGGSMLQTDSHPNQLMRNIGGSFTSVGKIAGVDDTRYGQGVAVGDFNEDGFPDLFVANLGDNQLLRNNGDGTFTDCSEDMVGNRSLSWSTSGAFVDIDADAITDLVVTQYCLPIPKLADPCPDENGNLGPCHPLTFPADRDQFFAGTADGQLVDRTEQWVGEPVPGRGLGVIAGALDGKEIGIFVANDMSRNSYYALTPDQPKLLIDSGMARGVAVDGRSLNQASMGIAASDLDLDGDLDMYVTGFGREYNIVYEQVMPGVWNDQTAKLDLIESTLTLVGFGTQAVDMDNDGIDELVVTNGNIGEFMDNVNRPYRQPIQIFRRNGDGTFALLDDDAWGDYFRDHHVGRALWLTDANRDGRNDVVVTHTREQIGLLINQTATTNNQIGLKLVATDCSRDGVGAVIRFKVNDQPRSLWLLSGDGYFCSNEKNLLAGIGEHNEITDTTVTWRDGSVDQLGTLQAGALYLVVQGQQATFTLDRYPDD